MGLLDPQLDPMTLGLLQASAGLLAPRRQGGGLAGGIAGFGQGLLQGEELLRARAAQANRDRLTQAQLDMTQKRFGMDEQRFGLEMQQYQAQQAKAAQQAKFVEEFVATASQRDPEIAALARVNLPAAIERAYPKPEWRTWFDEKGRQTQGYVAPNAAPRAVGSSERKVQAVPLGDRVEFVDPLAQSGPLKVGMSPGERDASARGWAGVGLTRRGQDMTDARARESAEAARAGRAPSGYVVDADGNLKPWKGGPADPATQQAKPPTEGQSNAYLFANRAAAADGIIAELDGKASVWGAASNANLSGLPLIGGAVASGQNMMLSSETQRYVQAKRDFINAVLRKESGAVIGKDEFTSADLQYFPQPGEGKDVRQQKAEARARAIQGLTAGAGPLAHQVGATGGGKPAGGKPPVLKFDAQGNLVQ
jgi:hypothetical protein